MKPVISIIMGSKSDWATMQKAAEVLDNFGVAYEKKVVSAHRTPDLMFKHAEEARSRGIKVIIAGAGGAAHLPGMVAAKTTLPVIGVPVKSRALSGVDSLYSIVQMMIWPWPCSTIFSAIRREKVIVAKVLISNISRISWLV